MVRIVLLVLSLSIFESADWVIVPTQDSHYKVYYNAKLKTSKWKGYPDPNYSWEGDILSYEREVTDEDGKKRKVKTFKKPYEIIADFKPEAKVYGIEGKIEGIAVRKFGGSLKGYIWLDKYKGGGQVILPFTAPHIFTTKGDRNNPKLIEIGTDPNEDNYYEIVEGKTHVFLKSFSGIGGAAGAPPTLIAHYKMNENTASDNDELVTNGVFDNGADWDLDGTFAIAAGVLTGTGDGTWNNSAYHNLTSTILNRTYKLQYEVTANTFVGHTDFYLAGISAFGIKSLSGSVGAHSYFLEITNASPSADIVFTLSNNSTSGSIIIDNVSCKLMLQLDSSGNDHDGLLQEDTSAAHVTGRVGGAFDFDGSADYIEIADHDDFTPALTAFSISAWVYMHDATDFCIASKGVEATDGEWRLYTNGSDKLFAHFYDESINKYIGRTYDAAALSENTWLHIVMTYDGGTTCGGIKLYLNGAKVDDADDESATFIAVENLAHVIWIGNYDGTLADGLIDNVMFFSVELSQDDVNRIYNNRSGTEIMAEIDPTIRPRRSASPFGLRARYEH